MNCQQFLAGFSDFLDGKIEEDLAGEMENHRSSCKQCGRYAHTVRSGLELPPVLIVAKLNRRGEIFNRPFAQLVISLLFCSLLKV